MKLYRQLASLVAARLNCMASGNDEWRDKHESEIERLAKEHLPSGGGFDLGTQIDLDKSHGNRLVFNTSFHHMNDAGMYDGWTSHQVQVVPDLQFGFDLKLKGRNRNDINEYIGEVFNLVLDEEVRS